MAGRLVRGIVVVGCVVAAVLLVASPARAATPAEVEASLAKARTWLYAQQLNGTWEATDTIGRFQSPQTGGLTALAVYALLASGESPQDPRLLPAIEYLERVETTGVYALGLRAQVWLLLPRTPERKRLIAKDAAALRAALITRGDGRGFYGYNPGTTAYSHSRGNYGVLGMWALSQCGVNVPADYWRTVEDAWVKHQDDSGGWSYTASGRRDYPLTPGMTAAGVATLFITQDHLGTYRGIDCKPAPANAALARGLKWLTDNFDKVATDETHPRDFPYATLYAVERVGVASGLRYFGDVDWYQKGSDWLLRVQGEHGNWPKADMIGTVADTCFAMVFLARGRAPLVMSKLDYGAGSEDPAKVGAWNARPRDAANLTRFVAGAAERDLNWQIVTLVSPLEDWHDAPILYVAGRDEWAPSDEHKTKLRQYVEQGGMILAGADCAGRAFAGSVRRLGKELFPAYDFRELPADHPIYTNQQFARERWKTKPSVLALGNGVRELVLLVPQADPGRAWQLDTVGGQEPLWQLGANVFQYAVDKRNLRFRGETHLVARDTSVTTDRTIDVARLEYAGNWDPEPGGWRRLVNVLHNRHKTDLRVAPVKLGSGGLVGGKGRVAHLTGTDAVNLDAPAQAELRQFVAAGGTLVVDAAGGSSAFAQSAEDLLAALFPGAKLIRLPPQHPLYAAGASRLEAATYRPAARELVGADPTPRLRAVEQDGRLVAVYSREDLTAGLVGQPVDGIAGYEPATATDLMTKILLFASEP